MVRSKEGFLQKSRFKKVPFFPTFFRWGAKRISWQSFVTHIKQALLYAPSSMLSKLSQAPSEHSLTVECHLRSSACVDAWPSLQHVRQPSEKNFLRKKNFAQKMDDIFRCLVLKTAFCAHPPPPMPRGAFYGGLKEAHRPASAGQFLGQFLYVPNSHIAGVLAN